MLIDNDKKTKVATLLVAMAVLAQGCADDDGEGATADESTGGEVVDTTGGSGPGAEGGASSGETAANTTDAAETSTSVGSADDSGSSTGSEEVELEPSEYGLLTAPSALTADETIAALDAAFEANEMVNLALRIDHQANGATVDMAIPPSTAYIFGNPNLGTPLMAENILASLDLPLRMLAWEDADGDVFVSYDSPGFLRARYGLSTVDTQLELATTALAAFASAGTGTSIQPTEGEASAVGPSDGIMTVTSTLDAPTTFAQLTAAIESNPNLNIAPNGIVDHQANAQSVDLELPFSSVVIFGNPAVGTPLIEGSLSIALDLPLKMAVVENESEVMVIYNDPAFLAAKHQLEGQTAMTDMVAAALAGLATAATTP